MSIGFPGGSVVKNPPAQQETQVQSGVGKIPRRKKWLPTPVSLPEEFHEQRSLVSYSPWGHKELDMTEKGSKRQRRKEKIYPFECRVPKHSKER